MGIGSLVSLTRARSQILVENTFAVMKRHQEAG